MKKLWILFLTASLVTLALAQATTTMTYEEDEYVERPLSPYEGVKTGERQEMQDLDYSSSSLDETVEKAVDYNDRTRTDRERHAINTSSDASDDQ